MLEKIAYKIPRNSEQKQVVYQVGDLEKLSATVLYYGNGNGLGSFGIVSTPLMKKNKGENSEFSPASNFGIGPGIAKQVEGFIERYRAGEHEKFGEDHINLEYISPVTKKVLINIHINMKDD